MGQKRLLLLAPLVLTSAAGCGTIYSISNNEPFPNIIYGGTRCTGHEVLDIPLSMAADTIALPYTIPRSIYNSQHPEDKPKGDADVEASSRPAHQTARK